jgi:AraC-like DNA-binding protein
MNIEHYPPSGIFQPYIKRFMIIESAEGTSNRILPDTSLVMAFRLKGSLRIQANGTIDTLHRSVITGLRNSPRLITYSKKSASLLVIFRENGAAAFFDVPPHKLFGLQLSADHLISPRLLSDVNEQLYEAKNNQQRIAVLERFLQSQLKEPQSHPLIDQAIRKINSAGGNITIKNLITELPVSRDPFEKKFRRVTGATPKKFSDIVRLRHIIDTHSQDKSLTETAHAAGYFDQSHFTKAFKSFTGQTPSAFFDAPSFW